MKDYKLLLTGVTLFLLLVFVALCTWLWTGNRKNTDPLPIMASDDNAVAMTTEADERTLPDSVLYLQAERSLQVPLDDVIVRFESRYPYVQVLTTYVTTSSLLKLSNDNRTDNGQTDFVFDTDIIFANGNLSAERLAPLQKKLVSAQAKHQKDQQNDSIPSEQPTSSDTNENDINADMAQKNIVKNTATQSSNTETRTLNAFSYALRDEQTLDAVILTDNTTAINFRNFLLSSAGQDILKKYDYYNIEGYKNSVADLFNPTQSASDSSAVTVADALSNGE